MYRDNKGPLIIGGMGLAFLVLFGVGAIRILSGFNDIVDGLALSALHWEHTQTVQPTRDAKVALTLDGPFFVYQNEWLAVNSYGERVTTPGLNKGGYTQEFGDNPNLVYYIRANKDQTLDLFRLQPPPGITARDYLASIRKERKRS